MHTVADEEFPFYRTIDLQMVSETKSYTTAGEPLFYLYPLRFDNRRYYNGTNQSVGRLENVADAEDICRNIGDGWRLPTASELLLSLVYENALGGNAINSNYHDGQNIYGCIKTGQVTTGLHHTMRLKALQHVLGWKCRQVIRIPHLLVIIIIFVA